MVNKSIIGVICTCLAVVSLNANAALINNGSFTSDDVTGLDWLDLSQTVNSIYANAEVSNPGWRYATNSEVENLFSVAFPMFVSNLGITASFAHSFYGPTYSEIHNEAMAFQQLFGPSNINTSLNIYSTLGLYRDEANVLREMGAIRSLNDGRTTVRGVQFTTVYDGLDPIATAGIYMVRADTVVPIPAAVWLFGSGLIGLIGVARRKVKV